MTFSDFQITEYPMQHVLLFFFLLCSLLLNLTFKVSVVKINRIIKNKIKLKSQYASVKVT